MPKLRLISVFLAALAVPVWAAPAHDFNAIVLEAHNQERMRLGLAPLVWSAQLEAQARPWAESLARRGAFEHSQDRSGAGENLWRGTAGGYGPDQMIGAFVGEGKMFRPGVFPQVSRTGNWYDVGHYTQLVWPGTKAVGCALARGKDFDVLVCRYYPAGNVIGQKVP